MTTIIRIVLQPKTKTESESWAIKLEQVRRQLARAYQLKIRAQRDFDRCTKQKRIFSLRLLFGDRSIEWNCAWIRQSELDSIDVILKAGRRLQAASDRVQRLEMRRDRYRLLYAQAKERGKR